MFGFGRKKEDPDRKVVREQFESVVKALRQADAASRVAVGHTINMMNSMFHQTYGGVDGFLRTPKSQRNEYMQKLSNMEVVFQEEKQDPLSSLGVALFKMWVGSVSEQDNELIGKFSRELEILSKEGDIGG
jgi:hypothetical protein|tara:strand:+ start:24 stop:416 length:393 start_codon:yes stop_codon:yes gene_type:complete